MLILRYGFGLNVAWKHFIVYHVTDDIECACVLLLFLLCVYYVSIIYVPSPLQMRNLNVNYLVKAYRKIKHAL